MPLHELSQPLGEEHRDDNETETPASVLNRPLELGAQLPCDYGNPGTPIPGFWPNRQAPEHMRVLSARHRCHVPDSGAVYDRCGAPINGAAEQAVCNRDLDQ